MGQVLIRFSKGMYFICIYAGYFLIIQMLNINSELYDIIHTEGITTAIGMIVVFFELLIINNSHCIIYLCCKNV